MEAKLQIKDNEVKKCFIIDKKVRDEISYKKKSKEEIKGIQKWKKGTVDKIVEKEVSKPLKVIDPRFFCQRYNSWVSFLLVEFIT